MPLVEIRAAEDDVAIDLVYATPGNLTGQPIYRDAVCYLHPDAAILLRRAVALARPLGMKIKILDAFRPAEAQWVLWSHLPDPAYIADPRRGSAHSMGAAIDVTLIDAANGAALDFGTAFDDMRPASWHADTSIPIAAQRNRAILLGLMTAAGFDFYRQEWWHYQLFRPHGRYPLLSDSILKRGLMRRP